MFHIKSNRRVFVWVLTDPFMIYYFRKGSTKCWWWRVEDVLSLLVLYFFSRYEMSCLSLVDLRLYTRVSWKKEKKGLFPLSVVFTTRKLGPGRRRRLELSGRKSRKRVVSSNSRTICPLADRSSENQHDFSTMASYTYSSSSEDLESLFLCQRCPIGLIKRAILSKSEWKKTQVCLLACAATRP